MLKFVLLYKNEERNTDGIKTEIKSIWRMGNKTAKYIKIIFTTLYNSVLLACVC